MINDVIDPYEGMPASFAFTAKDNRGNKGQFDYYRAQNGMLFLSNVPDNLALFYQAGFQPIPATPSELAVVAEDERFKIDQLKRFIKGGKYLEIGPWIGMAAYAASTAGFDVTTLEMNSDCVDLMNRAGLRAIQTIDSAAWLAGTEEKFDAIVLWHSIEHLAEPWNVLDLAMQRLQPGGVILVATPNPASAQASYFGEKWFHLDAPRHLFLLPVEMVEDIGKRHGLMTVDCTTDDRLSMLLDRQGWEWPLMKHAIKLPVGRDRAGQLAVTAGALMARKFRKGGNDGGAYTLIMQRPM